MIPAIIIFAVSYVLMLAFSKYRPYIALGTAALFLVLGMLPWGSALGTIDYNVILMIAGTMGLVALFVDSRMPQLLADLIMEKVSTVQAAAVCMALFAGVISAFVDNVATVLMVAPVALALCKKFGTNPVPFIIAIAVSSNLQGAATLVGDTTAIMLGSAVGMSFTDFFWYLGSPGMFFAVELGAVLSALILMYLFRKDKAKLPRGGERTKVTDFVPTFLLAGAIVLLILASFLPVKPDITNGLICCALFAVGLIYRFIRERSPSRILAPFKEIDFETIGLLLGLFIMIGAIEHQGVIDLLASGLVKLGGSSPFLMYTVLVWASVLISAFIDNIPYVATMIPVIGAIGTQMGVDPTVFYFGLLSGATLGGNCTPVGASANITGIGILRKEGYTVRNSDFFKIGIPFTLAAVIPAYIYLWLAYGIN
ncbi:MAG: TRAP transporter large permease subunit [Clostridia bacterium]|nr:TRAP transporter large permease subunit [Clostridia bacterium]